MPGKKNQTVAIKDLSMSQAVTFCYRNSVAPSPTASQPCVCAEKDCGPGICCSLHRQCKQFNDSQPEQDDDKCLPTCKGSIKSTTAQDDDSCSLTCKGSNKGTTDDNQELRDGSGVFQQDCCPIDKKVSMRDLDFLVREFSDLIPDCCKPATSRPVPNPAFDPSTVPKDSYCESCKSAGLQSETYPSKPAVQKKKSYCSDETCGKDSFSASSSSEDTSAEAKQSTSEVPPTPKLWKMPLGTPPPRKRTSNTIAKTSSKILNAKLSKSSIKDPDEEKKDRHGKGPRSSSQKLFGWFGKNNDKSSIHSICSCVIVEDEKTDDVGAENKNASKPEIKEPSKTELKDTFKADIKNPSNSKKDLTEGKNKQLSPGDGKKDINKSQTQRVSKDAGKKDQTKMEARRPSKDVKNSSTKIGNKRLSQEGSKRNLNSTSKLTKQANKKSSQSNVKKEPSKELSKRFSQEDSKKNDLTEEKDKNLSKDDGDDKKDDETNDDKKDKPSKTCGKASCSVKSCSCRFPPAYSQYFDCTGRIGGQCNCDENT